jgi:hypothetical protein
MAKRITLKKQIDDFFALWRTKSAEERRPIEDCTGTTDHRGRKFPTCGCWCEACLISAVTLVGRR